MTLHLPINPAYAGKLSDRSYFSLTDAYNNNSNTEREFRSYVQLVNQNRCLLRRGINDIPLKNYAIEKEFTAGITNGVTEGIGSISSRNVSTISSRNISKDNPSKDNPSKDNPSKNNHSKDNHSKDNIYAQSRRLLRNISLQMLEARERYIHVSSQDKPYLKGDRRKITNQINERVGRDYISDCLRGTTLRKRNILELRK